MAEVKGARPKTESDAVVDRAKDFWSQYGKMISIVLGAVIVLVGGFLIYKNFIQGPKEKKAADAIANVQTSFDSLYNVATGDTIGRYVDMTITGAESVIKQYGSTKSGNLSHLYAGIAYIKKGNLDKAISHLKEFETGAPQIQALAYKLLGDALSQQGKAKEAVDYYKKSANEFEEDDARASEALFMAAYTSEKLLNDKAAAKELYKEVKAKYPNTQWSSEAEKYLAVQGEYNAE